MSSVTCNHGILGSFYLMTYSIFCIFITLTTCSVWQRLGFCFWPRADSLDAGVTDTMSYHPHALCSAHRAQGQWPCLCFFISHSAHPQSNAETQESECHLTHSWMRKQGTCCYPVSGQASLTGATPGCTLCYCLVLKHGPHVFTVLCKLGHAGDQGSQGLPAGPGPDPRALGASIFLAMDLTTLPGDTL
jgi:hypothetical protein